MVSPENVTTKRSFRDDEVLFSFAKLIMNMVVKDRHHLSSLITLVYLQVPGESQLNTLEQ